MPEQCLPVEAVRALDYSVVAAAVLVSSLQTRGALVRSIHDGLLTRRWVILDLLLDDGLCDLFWLGRH